jgi:hypothetical protein
MIGGRAFNRAAIDGTLDEVRLYNKALSASEVKESMKHAASASGNFIGYWDFETGSDANNNLLSRGYNKELIARMYDVTVISEGNNQYTAKPFVFVEGYTGEDIESHVITENSDQTIKVAVLGDEIKLYGTTQGEAIAIYSANGLLFANAMGEDSVTTINTSAKGLLIIKVGEQVFKVVK